MLVSLFFTQLIIAQVAQSKLLNELAILMSHDAASGYLTRTHVVADWTNTQGIDLVGQLECGSRSFDYRPYYKDGVLYAHHGGVKIDVPMEQAIDEVTAWSIKHPTDLVYFYINKCEGDDGCNDATKELLASKKIYSITDCNQLATLSTDDIRSAINSDVAGQVFAVFDCMDEEYDSSVTCYHHDYTCYDSWPKDTAAIPWQHMSDYAINTTTVDAATAHGSRLWMVQTHWQSSAGSITLGTAHRSDLLIDEEKSGVNTWVAKSITEGGVFERLNIVEVDNVCDAGVEIYAAINAYNAAH